jgi:molybdate transport system substrate-binding protein
LIIALLATAVVHRAAGAPASVSVAAAANLTYVIEALNAAFARATPGVRVTTTLGSSGNLSAQIRNGAPFDVFLSADVEYPRALAAAGFGDPKTLRTFAVGRLVLWTMRSDIDPADVPAVVHAATVKRLAMAQPRTAPYGRAAQAALESLGLLADARPKLVTGENIAQTAQFVQTGNADAGFVALSFVVSPRLAQRGHWTIVPEKLYRQVSLDHACVVTKHGAANPAAREYLAFLQSETARRIFEQYGYGVPPSAPR